MSRMGSVKKKGATLFLKQMSFLAELQPRIILFLGIPTSSNNSRSDFPLFFGYQITVRFFGLIGGVLFLCYWDLLLTLKV
jgi:hypothetical protein